MNDYIISVIVYTALSGRRGGNIRQTGISSSAHVRILNLFIVVFSTCLYGLQRMMMTSLNTYERSLCEVARCLVLYGEGRGFKFKTQTETKEVCRRNHESCQAEPVNREYVEPAATEKTFNASGSWELLMMAG